MKLFLSALLLTLAAAAPGISAPTPTPQAAATVQMIDFAFKPAKLTVHVGDTVLFVNKDSDAHTVDATDKSFASGGLDTNDSWSHTFTKAGSYSYFCSLHPYMKGVITVVAPAQKGSGS